LPARAEFHPALGHPQIASGGAARQVNLQPVTNFGFSFEEPVQTIASTESAGTTRKFCTMSHALRNWLEHIGLQQHAETFAANGIDFDVLQDLSSTFRNSGGETESLQESI
jgi:SAM domain (Sterile alpha motif)